MVKSEDKQNNPSIAAEAIGLLSIWMERLIMASRLYRAKDTNST